MFLRHFTVGLAGRERYTTFFVAEGVISHWCLDVVAHRRAVPVLPYGPCLGLAVWYSVPAT